MAVAAGQICVEAWKHTASCRYVYQRTGYGDWWRWALLPSQYLGQSNDSTVLWVTGVTRGKVYAGWQKLPTESDANSGFTGTATARILPVIRHTTSVSDYRDFNVPEGATHCRALGTWSSGWGTLRLSVMAGTTVLSYEDSAITTQLCPRFSSWVAIPATATKIRIHKAADDSKYIGLAAVEFINVNSEVDPDTAASMMFDGVAGDTQVVSPVADPWTDDYNHYGDQICPTIYWADAPGGTFNAAGTDSIGGMYHRGVNTGTLTWETQTGADEKAAWSPTAGDKLACNYLLETITTAKAYREAACTNYRGTLTGSHLFDANGVTIEHNYAVDQSVDMNAFHIYLTQMRLPRHHYKIAFGGQSTTYYTSAVAAGTQVSSPVPTNQVRIWGAPHKTLIEMSHHTPADYDYYRLCPTAKLPRVIDVASATPGPISRKCYFMRYLDETTPLVFANGTSIHSKFTVRLSDDRQVIGRAHKPVIL